MAEQLARDGSARGLQFTRDGRYLAVRATDALTIVRVSDGLRVQCPCAGVVSIAAFGDEVWSIDPHSMLRRWKLDGSELGAGLHVVGSSDGSLLPARIGPASAVLGAQLIGDDLGTLRVVAIDRDSDLAVPIAGRRVMTARGSRIWLGNALECPLLPGSRIVSMTTLFDGAAALALIQRPDAREAIVIGTTNAQTRVRVAVPVGDWRIASRRGVALVRTGAQTLVAIDLRQGCVIGDLCIPGDVLEVAIDPDAQQVAVQDTSEGIHVYPLAALLAASRINASTAQAPSEIVEVRGEELRAAESIASAAIDVVDLTKPAPVTRDWFPAEDLAALAPIVPAAPIDRARALAHLDHEIRGVALWALQAIARAWDSRQLGYGNEGRHPFELEVAALLGMSGGYAEDYVASAREHLAAHARTAAEMPDLRGPSSALGALGRELGLSPLALDLLMVVAAPALWGEAARLYGILANDAGRALVDELLIEQLLGANVDRHELTAELDPGAPLVRLGIIHVDPARARPFAALAVDPVVLARLRCKQPDLGSITVRQPERAIADLVLGAGVLSSAGVALARCVGPGRIVLRGQPGSGRRSLLAAISDRIGRPLGVLDVTQLPRAEAAFLAAFRIALGRAHLAGLLPCVIGLDAVSFDGRPGRDVTHDILRAHPGPVAVVQAGGSPAPFDPGHVAIDLPVLVEGDRIGVWTDALASAKLWVRDVDALAARYRIGPGVIHRAVVAAREVVRADETTPDLEPDATEEIERYIRQTRDARLGAYAQRVERLATWSGLVLPSDVLDSLRELIARVRHRRLVFETWGMDRTMATSRALTALFQGQPGTGKTLVAGVIARELGLDLYRVDLSKVTSKWIGETERNLGAIFDAAEDGQVILLFDEADSLFARRTEVKSSNDRYANLEVNYLLQRLDSFEGIAILTTNSGGAIDPAFKRRLSFRLSFPFPDEDTRAQLWRVHLPPQLPIAGELALDKLAHKYQLSGGYIRNACLRAAFLAAQDEGPLHQHHLERAVALEFAELGKLSTSGTMDA